MTTSPPGDDKKNKRELVKRHPRVKKTNENSNKTINKNYLTLHCGGSSLRTGKLKGEKKEREAKRGKKI